MLQRRFLVAIVGLLAAAIPAQIQSSQDMAERTQSVRALNKVEVRARMENIARDGIK